jgi:hypothetical protein
VICVGDCVVLYLMHAMCYVGNVTSSLGFCVGSKLVWFVDDVILLYNCHESSLSFHVVQKTDVCNDTGLPISHT